MQKAKYIQQSESATPNLVNRKVPVIRQYPEKRNASIHQKTGFPRYNIFSHPSLLTVEYSSGYLLFTREP